MSAAGVVVGVLLAAFYLTLLTDIRRRWRVPLRAAAGAAAVLWSGIVGWAILLGIGFNVLMRAYFGG